VHSTKRPTRGTLLIEAAIDSIASAERAVAEGADRLEVCANLGVGGLTPSTRLLRHCLTLGVPCLAMVRHRAGDFVYGAAEVANIHATAREMCEAGAAGTVFGILRRDSRIDAHATRGLVEIAAGKQTVFHRAFDATPDAVAALDTLIACGVTRVLTAGQASSAVEGADMLAALKAHAAGRIEILAGGGVRAPNVVELVRRSGLKQIHARATEPGVVAALRLALANA
jgi:copper homeostasis protein